MKKLYYVLTILAIQALICLHIIGCKEKENEKQFNNIADTAYMIGKSYKIGLANLKDSFYLGAILEFESVRKEDKYYDSAQELLKIAKEIESEKKIEADKTALGTTLLAEQIEKLCNNNGIINNSLLLEELLKRRIILEDDVIEYVSDGDYLRDSYFDEFKDEYPNYDNSNDNDSYYYDDRDDY